MPPGTQPGSVLRIKGKAFRAAGDQLVQVAIEVPTALTAKQRELIETLAKERRRRRRWRTYTRWQRPEDFIPVHKNKRLQRAGFGFHKKDDVRRMLELCAEHGIDGQVYMYPQVSGDLDSA